MPTEVRDPVREQSAKWAYLGAFMALAIVPPEGMAAHMARMTPGPEALVRAIICMRNAPQDGRVQAALDYLRGLP